MGAIKDLLLRIRGDSSQLQKETKKAEGTLGKFKKVVKSVGVAMGAAFAVGAILRFGKAMITAASETEAAFKKIETLVGLSREQVQGMEKDVNNLAKETGQSTKQLADALFTVTSAGARGSEAMEILERAAKASAAGLGETQQIAQAVTAVMQAYGSENVNAAQATDILLATVREGNLEASALAGTIGRVLPLASQLGISFEDVGANVATFTRLGVSAEEAIVGLRGVMSALLTENKAGQVALEGVGSSYAKIRQEIKEKGLQTALGDLVGKFKGNATAIRAIIPDTRALTTVLGTAGAQAEAYAEISDNMTKSQGLVDAAFQETTKTFKFKFQQAVNGVKTTFESLAGKVLPLLIKGMDFVGGIIKDISSGFNDLFESSEAFRIAIGLFGATFKSVFTVIGGFINQFVNGFKTLAKIIGAAFKGQFKQIPGIAKEGFKNVINIAADSGTKIMNNFGNAVKKAKNPVQKEIAETIAPSPIVKSAAEKTGQVIAETIRSEITKIDPLASLFDARGDEAAKVKKRVKEVQAALAPLVGEDGRTVSGPRIVIEPELNTTKFEEQSVLMAQLMDNVSDAAADMGEAIMQAGIQSEGSMEDFGKTVLNIVRKTISAFIAQGVAAAMRDVFTSPTGQALGPFAVAAAAATGGLASALFNSAIPSFADGGFVSKPTMAMIGDARDGKGEYVLNSGQMDNLRGSGGGTLSTRVSGRDLLFVLKQENDFNSRT